MSKSKEPTVTYFILRLLQTACFKSVSDNIPQILTKEKKSWVKECTQRIQIFKLIIPQSLLNAILSLIHPPEFWQVKYKAFYKPTLQVNQDLILSLNKPNSVNVNIAVYLNTLKWVLKQFEEFLSAKKL